MTKNYTQGDIVIIPWPYDDLTGTKNAPSSLFQKTTFQKSISLLLKLLLY